jgi:hypothetical protein
LSGGRKYYERHRERKHSNDFSHGIEELLAARWYTLLFKEVLPFNNHAMKVKEVQLVCRIPSPIANLTTDGPPSDEAGGAGTRTV